MNNTALLGDKPINRIGFGAMALAGPGVFGPPSDPAAVRAVLKRAIELGVDHIDTAQCYGPDELTALDAVEQIGPRGSATALDD